MFKTLFDFLLNRKGHPAPQEPAKVEATPAPAAEAHLPKIEPMKCGCGRSPTGYCVGLHKLTAEQWNGHPANPAPVKAEEAKPAPAVKAPRVGKTAAITAKAADAKKKPAAKKAPAKPRAKKAKE